MQKDGSLAADASDIEVAAAAFDLFDAYEGALRPFFGMVMRSATLRWFSVPNAGLDSPVFTAVLERGVRLTNAHVTDIPISEFVLRSVLDHFQQAERWRDAQRRRAWDRHQFREVAGTTWLIVGLGTIGQAVAVRARAFGARVIGCRRNPDWHRTGRRVRRAPRPSHDPSLGRRRRALPSLGTRRRHPSSTPRSSARWPRARSWSTSLEARSSTRARSSPRSDRGRPAGRDPRRDA